MSRGWYASLKSNVGDEKTCSGRRFFYAMYCCLSIKGIIDIKVSKHDSNGSFNIPLKWKWIKWKQIYHHDEILRVYANKTTKSNKFYCIINFSTVNIS